VGTQSDAGGRHRLGALRHIEAARAAPAPLSLPAATGGLCRRHLEASGLVRAHVKGELGRDEAPLHWRVLREIPHPVGGDRL
jgi:hypothetical protein